MRLAHYYHAYVAPGWESVVEEHFAALEKSGLKDALDSIHVGVVGEHSARIDFINLCTEHFPVVYIVAEADTGWEQVTLNRLHANASDYDAVLYAHSKGVTSWEDREFIDAWRRSMTLGVITGWRACVELLNHYEAVGSHWLTPANKEWPDCPVTIPLFGGNFWWARSSLIQRLTPPLLNERYDAETWLGRAPDISVFDVAPGWPAFHTFLT